MDYLTSPLETASRKEIDRILQNLGWKIDEFNKDCNVFTERVRTKDEEGKLRKRFPNGKFPDYVLYSSKDYQPIAVIEVKRIGTKLEDAIRQAKEYAEPIGVKIIFGVDGSIVEARWVDDDKPLKIDGYVLTEIPTEKTMLRFIQQGSSEIFTPQKVTRTKDDLITIFHDANDLLRQEGMREGIERFTEFSNLLFLKLIDEIEDAKEQEGEKRNIEIRYCWQSFCKKESQEMLDYINDTVLPKLVDKYNHSGDVFSRRLGINNSSILKRIVDKLSELTLLDVDSDIKGDAFEYFLKNSVTVGNDLGEYYTPRHIVRLMVELINPKFGEKVYDPCCGTGGFLIEAFRHIKRNCSLTKSNLEILQNETIYGGELTGTAKIAKMNMILAGDGHTHIIQHDSLKNPYKEKFDVILTNFPFSQKTEYAHLYGLSSRMANHVFLKHVIDALKPNGRAAVVVPDSLLFSKHRDIVNIRKQLVENCEIQAIIQLGSHTFSPYTQQPTSILIFKKTKSTQNIWFFEVTHDGFTNNSKRYPTEKNDLLLLRSSWHDKSVSDSAFSIQHSDVHRDSYNLFLNFYKNYVRVNNPIQLGKLCKHMIIGATPDSKKRSYYGGKYLWVTIGDMQTKVVSDSKDKLSAIGAEKLGSKRLIKAGTLLVSFKLTIGRTAFAGQDLFTNEAICALVLKDEYDTDYIKEYLYHILPLLDYSPYAQRATKGLTLNKDLLANVEIPLPPEDELISIVENLRRLSFEKEELEQRLQNNMLEHLKFINDKIIR